MYSLLRHSLTVTFDYYSRGRMMHVWGILLSAVLQYNLGVDSSGMWPSIFFIIYYLKKVVGNNKHNNDLLEFFSRLRYSR